MSKRYYGKENKYSLDFDENGVLIINKHNAGFIEAIIRIDSNYRHSFEFENEAMNEDEYSSAAYIRKYRDNFEHNKSVLEEICKRIDKENSTHLSVSGNKPGDNKGIEITSQELSKIENLADRLKDGDPKLVYEIANFMADKKQNKFSFSTKFCTYMCRNLYADTPKADNYVIYDKVIAGILPYYAWKYNASDRIYVKKGIKHTNSLIKETFMDERNYEGYRDLIDRILDNAAIRNSERLSREEFDSLLWYYYKGRDDEIEKALEVVIQ